MAQDILIWYGTAPLPGVHERLEARGFLLKLSPVDAEIKDNLLSVSTVVVFYHGEIVDLQSKYRHLRQFIDHGIRVLMVADRHEQIQLKENLRTRIDESFPWEREVVFMTDTSGTNFDNFINVDPVPKWKEIKIEQQQLAEKLRPDEKLLMARAFPKAEKIHVTEIKAGFSGSRVFMVYEKRREDSIAHWAQPRLVKIGARVKLAEEVGNMRAVAPFVPFELRPNLDIYVNGFEKAVFVADFVENSESLLEAARAGRAEAAISNLFNRTLHRWRDRAWECQESKEALATTAERLNIISPTGLRQEYTQAERIQTLGLDFDELWTYLKSIHFDHRVASIHGDLHGDNVRVRGDDAILIDLGSVIGAKKGDAPLCFDVAMLEVALVFSYTKDDQATFEQPEWESDISGYYLLDAIQNTPDRDASRKPTSWIFGCLQRIRAFGIYDQSHPHEYAIALAIAMWRWCKFESLSAPDKGRRVVALAISAKIISQIKERQHSESLSNTRSGQRFKPA